jgi:hypothetical protein
MNVPMLDEGEYAEISELHRACLGTIKEYRKRFNVPLDQVPPIMKRCQPMLDAYHRLTGMREENPNAIRHHRISIYGPPCPRCGKVLRTPIAFKCFECGLVVRANAHG